MAAISLKDINKVYPNGFKAIHDLNLEIAEHEFLVLVGPSGCGKSTALRMIAGLEDITSGTLQIGDRVVNDVEPKNRDIAMVFQNYALYPHMTVEENIGFSLRLRKMAKAQIKKRVLDTAKILELEEQLPKKPVQLSGGQRQRVAMGRAIVRNPAAFLMDEPLSNLDAKLRVQMRFEIAKLQRDLRVTTVYVTHDQIEAMTMGDRVAVLKDGRLSQVDAPQNLYDHPANVFVAAFIGSPSMNLYEADYDGKNLRIGDHAITVPDVVLKARPQLKNYIGERIIVGFRPEDLEDADLSPRGEAESRLNLPVVVVEALGAELVVHCELDAQRVDAGDPDAVVDIGPAVCVGRFSPRSHARAGDVVEVAVDTEKLHFFDLATHDAIGRVRGR